MKLKQFIFTLVVMLSSFVMSANAQVAKIGEQGYPTLKAALTAATNGDIITLLANNAESVTINQTDGVSITVDGDGKTYSGVLTINGSGNASGEEILTFKNVVFKTNSKNGILPQNSSHNVIFDACTFNGSNGGYFFEIKAGQYTYNYQFVNGCVVDMTGNFWQAMSATSNLVVDGMHVVNGGNVFKINYGSNTKLPAATFKDVRCDNAGVFIYAMNSSAMTFNVKNCNITAAYPFAKQDKAADAHVTVNIDTKSKLTSNNGSDVPYIVANLGAKLTWNVIELAYVAKIGDTEYETFAEAFEAAQPGQTIVLLADYTGEPVTLTAGVKLDANGFNAEGITVTTEVTTKAELNAAIANAVAGDVIKLAANINYGTDQLKIEKKITLDLGGKTLTTGNAYGGMSIKNGATVKNGNIVHTATVAAIKVWNATAFENLTIEVPGVGNTEKVIGGIVIQEGSTVRVDAIKNVTIKGAGLTNGIQTYNCGTAKENVIGSMENVNIDAVGVAMNVYAPCGTATNCTFKGGNYGIEIWIKGNYNATLDLVNCEVVGGGDYDVFAHDEFKDHVTNNGTLKLTADAATGLDNSRVNTVVLHESNIAVENEGTAQAQTFRLFYTNKAPESVAKIGEQGYATLAEALAAATAGQTITFLADITEDVTVSTAVTIDGAGKTYTGAMELKADATIKNLNFDGKGYNGYAITTRGANYLTIEDCTAANYGYGFVQLASATVLTTVKNVTVSNMNYGVKVDYSSAVVLDNVDITAGVAAVLNSNYGEKTITINGSKLNILGTWTRNNTIKTNYVFEGANTIDKFITDAAIDNFKLAVAATLTAPEEITVTTVDGYEVKYENGIYTSVEKMNAVAKVGEQGYATLDEAFAAAAAGQNVELVAANYEAIAIPEGFTGKLVINSDVVVNNANGSAITGKVINISGNGTLTAIAAGNHAYGIGGDNTESITIEGVHIAKVQGGRYGEIGTDTKYYKDAPEGGAAIGSGYNGAVITLTNVKIDEALGGSKAAGIGALYHTGVTINITGCTITKVEGGATAAAIGGSRVSKGATASEAVTINIQNSTIEGAKGGAYAAGIGSGYDTYCQANQPICTINIEGSKITATGGKYAAGVGTGYHNAGLAGEIKNSEITAASGEKVYKDKYTSAQDIGFGVADLAREGSNNDSHIVYNGTMIALPGNVAKIGETGYKTLAEAIAAATAGQTITFVADITEDVEVSKAVTIDGAGKTYTGAMTLKADATIKNLNFDGKGYNGYAITTRGAQYLTIEDCTAKKYGYGFVQLASATALTTVKDVTVSGMNYGVKVDYSGAVALENVEMTAGVAAVLNSNYGEKTITIKNSKLNILGTWTRNSTIKTNYLFEGANTIDKFITDAAIDNFKLVAGATLTAPNDITVTTVEKYEVKYEKGVYTSVEKPSAVVMIGENGYETLADALAAATAGQTITFVADITEDVEVSKAVTIDGAGKTYTGAMTIKADATIKNLNFDGKGYDGYAITTRGAQYLTIEDCTAKNYGYGFVQLASATALTTVKNVTVSDMGYGVKSDYSNAVVLENVDITATVAAVLNSNYGEKTITIKNSKLNILGTWKRKDAIKTNYVFEGANTIDKFITEDALDNFKLAAGATLTAPEGKTVTTVDGYEVKYENGVYTSVEKPTAVAMIGEEGYETLAAAIAAAKADQTITLLADIESSDIITINKAITLDGNSKTLTSTAGRAINIETEGKVVINNLTVKAAERAFNIINKAATVELNGVTATANNNAVMIATSAGAANVTINSCNFTGLAVVNVAGAGAQVVINDTKITNKDANEAENYGAITVYSTATNAKVTVNGGSITVEDDSKKAYIFAEGATVTGVDQIGQIVAMIGDAGYETLTEAIADANAGQTVKMVCDVTMKDILVINKAITLDGNGKTLTSTAGRAINVDGANGVTIKNLTINASGERAINVINGATNVTVENVTATAANYAVNLAGSAANAVVTVKNSNLTGLNVVNVAAPGAKVTVTGGTLVCNDQTDVESYAALAIATNASKATITATGVTFDIKGDSSKASNGTTDGTITIDDVVVGQRVAMIQYANGTAYTFDNLAAAVAKAEAGETVKLLADINLSDILVINKAITLDGNGKTLTSTAGRAINVSGADGVTIKDLTINAKGERAINVIQNATNVTIDNVTATAANYTVNVAGSAPEAVVAINNSTLNGLCTVNVAAAAAQVTIDNSTVNCNDNNTTAGESYAALCLNKAAVGASIVAKNTTVNVAAGSDSEKGRNGAENGSVTINGSTEGVTVTVAAITYPGSDNYYGFTSLAAAIEFAKADDVITLIRDVNLSEILVINKAITLDGNGKKLTSTAARAINVDGADGVKIQNLTIVASGERAINVIQNATNVTIDNVTATAKNYTVNVAGSAPEAVVAIKNSTLNGLCTVNVAAAGAKVTVDNSTVNCNDNNTTAGESYAALCLNKDAVGGSIVATNTIVNVTEGSDSQKGRNGAENGTVTINGSTDGVTVMVAAITYQGSDYYHSFASLAEAVEFAKAGETVKLLRDATGAGAVINKSITIDFNGKTYTANAGVGSTGTETLALQILKGDVVLKNGTLTSEGANIKMLINNYTNLIVDNMKLVDDTDAIQYVLSNNSGEVVIKNASEITSDAVALDACKYASYAKPTVTVAEGVTVNGNVEVSATLNMNGTLNGEIVINGTEGVVNGAEGLTVTTNIADYKVVVNNNGAYTVAAKNNVAQVGEAKFESLREAVEAAASGATVELLADVTLEGGYAQDPEAGLLIDKAITLDGKNHTIDCGTFVKGIRIYGPNGLSDIKINNVTVVNNNVNGRCVDTRKGYLRLKFSNAKLVATNGNSQPLTVGGSEQLHQIDLSNCTIDAGNSGYAIISFVPTNQAIKIMNSTVTGYAGIYLKGDGTKVTITTNSDVIGKNVHTAETNGFGAVVIEGNNNTVNINATSPMLKAVAEGGAEQAAILIKSGTGNKVVLETSKGANIVAEGENAYWAMINEAAEATITKNGAEVALVAEANGYQFVSFEEAVRFAKNGGEIKLLSNVALDTKTLVTCGGYSSIFNVKGMELTFDLNGHTITVDANPADLTNAKQNMLMGVFTVDDGGKLTIDDSSEAKNGAVNVNANGATVYSLASAYGKDAKLIINNGSYCIDEMVGATSLIYAQRSESVIINGGTYNVGNLGTGANGSPWIFNTKGQNVDGIYVYGGTYPTDINHQFWFNEAIVPGNLAVKANGDGTWSVVEAAAYTREIGRSTGSWRRNVGYATIEEAIAATKTRNCEGNVVTLAKNVELENTITVANGVEVTLNLNGNTISGTDNGTASFGLITNKGNLTIEGDGAITLTATQDRGWNAFSSVISNTVGGKLTVNGGTIEHLGGTDMAYGIDNLTNGKGTYAETEINGGTVKSTYRAIRMFLNGIEAQNILTVNGGTIEGANKSIWMQDPSANANTGNLYVGEKAVLNGDVYLTMTAGSTQWPVEAYIEKAALAEGKTVLSNVPADAAAALVAYDTFWQVEQKNLDKLTIVDEDYAEYINKVEKNVGVLTYVRNFENTEWQTIILPFEVPVEALTAAGLQAAYIYNASYKNGAATIDHVVMTEGSLAANYPYFVRATEAGEKSVVVENAVLKIAENYAIDCSSVFEKFTFTGTYNAVNADNLDENKGHFVKESENWETMENAYAFRVYLTIELRNGNAFVNPQAIRMRSVNANGETTGIDGVDAEQAGDFIFDLHGRRVLETEKGGIYIKGGKKFIAQ